MEGKTDLPQVCLGVFSTLFYKLERISAKYGKSIRTKRDDLCGVALGGNKMRKLEFLLADAKARSYDIVFVHTGGAAALFAMDLA